MIKLDLGCGKNKVNSTDSTPFIGVDVIPFDGVDLVCDLSSTTWLFSSELPEYGEIVALDNWRIKDSVVDEVFSSHFVEHLDGAERINFFNELHRILKPGGKVLVVTPDWSHASAYGDPTHKWPPMSSWYPLYLNKQWRDVNAPHVGFTCDFDWSYAASWDEWLNTRQDDVKTFAMQRYINSVRGLHITLVKR